MSAMRYLPRSVLGQLPRALMNEVLPVAFVEHAAPRSYIPNDNAVFPVDGIISMRSVGLGPEVANVGREAGFCLPTDEYFDLIAQTACTYIRIPMVRLSRFLQSSGHFNDLARQCDKWIFQQAKHLAACNVSHSVSQRVARFLVRMTDLYGATYDLPIIQETIASALGTRRSTMTNIFLDLRVVSRRGMVKIFDVDHLRARACPCADLFGPSRWPRCVAESEDSAISDFGSVSATALPKGRTGVLKAEVQQHGPYAGKLQQSHRVNIASQ